MAFQEIPGVFRSSGHPEEIEFSTSSLLYFLSLPVLFNFQGKLTCFCVYFSFILYVFVLSVAL